MAENIRHGLLKPSLSSGVLGPMFSGEAAFVVALLGGTIALTLLSLVNSYRARRLKRDLPWYALALTITAAFCVAFVVSIGGAAEGADDGGPYTVAHIIVPSQSCAMLLCGAYYFLHRSAHRITRLSGGRYARGFLPGILFITSSYALLSLVLTLLSEIAGAS